MNTEQGSVAERIVMSKEVQQGIYEFVGKHPAERGGILGADADGVIRHFAADPTARCTPGAYDPDLDEMNRQIKLWKNQNIKFVGFVHSHPRGFKQLSYTDEEYATKILAAFKSLDRLCLPLAMTVPDYGRFEIIPFVAIPNSKDRKMVRFEAADVVIETTSKKPVRQESKRTHPPGSERVVANQNGGELQTNTSVVNNNTPSNEAASEASLAKAGESESFTAWRYYGNFPSAWREPDLRKRGQRAKEEGDGFERLRELTRADSLCEQAARHFERVSVCLDIPLLDNSRLVIIGEGGAASLIRNSARCAFGEYILIDPDQISESNIGSQSADPRRIGTAKVDVLADEIQTINPASAVLAMRCKIEEITDADFEDLIKAPLRFWNKGSFAGVLGSKSFGRPRRPSQIVLMGLTDNFEAQARVHRLGLQYGLATICAQEYHERDGGRR